MPGLLQRILAHPLTRGLDLDAPETTTLRREIILSKPFLKNLYTDWYRLLLAAVPDGPQPILEVGAGGGFLKTIAPDAIVSEVFLVPHVDLVASATALPFEDASLRAILMTNVFHHLPDVPAFLEQAERTLCPGGRIVMIEPWNTSWSRFVHEKFHNEDFVPGTPTWEFDSQGPVSSANAALPWVVVARDRKRLESEWRLEVRRVTPMMPFSYVVSGGVSLRSLQPGWSYPLWRWIDSRSIFLRRFPLFALIELERMADQG